MRKKNLDSTKSDNQTSFAKGKALTMAELMQKTKSSFITLHKRDNVSGIITKLSSAEILVDIGAKTEAVVLEKDRRILKSFLSGLKVGDKVLVMVLNPESDSGNPVVSLRKFVDDRIWEKLERGLEKKEIVEVVIDEATKGGFLVHTKDYAAGFLPNSHVVFMDSANDLIGKTIKVSILELNRPLRKVIFSQKNTDSSDFDDAVKNLSVDQKITSTISKITDFGIFTIIHNNGKNLQGFIHISDISWDEDKNNLDNFKIGDKIEVAVAEINKKEKRIKLSIKLLTPDTFIEKIKAYPVDKKVKGKIVKIDNKGILVELEKGLRGLIKKEKIPPTVVYKEGAGIEVTVSQIDLKRRNIFVVPVLTDKPIGYR